MGLTKCRQTTMLIRLQTLSYHHYHPHPHPHYHHQHNHLSINTSTNHFTILSYTSGDKIWRIAKINSRLFLIGDELSHLTWDKDWQEEFPLPPIPQDDKTRCDVVDSYQIFGTEAEPVSSIHRS